MPTSASPTRAEQEAPDRGRPHVVLGVGGGVAAYKAAILLRSLTESGHAVTVVPTASALRFVGAATWEALSGRPVRTSVWDDVPEVPHVGLGRRADLVVVAPCTADLLARLAAGRSDDLLAAVLLTARCPVVLAPAMHTEMWEHPATRDNVALLRSRGTVVLEPAQGRLTGADSGPGRLPDPGEVAAVCRVLLADAATATATRTSSDEHRLLLRDLAGRHVVVSAGGTREPLDPVRWLGNRSSGRQGVALARAAAARGARVTLVAAHLGVAEPAGATVHRVGTAEELAAAVHGAAADADLVVMAAAVADFRPAAPSRGKIKKSDGVPVLELEPTPDVLGSLVRARLEGSAPTGQVLVGFAAETGDARADALTHGRSKLAGKGCDVLVVNEVGPPGHATGFEADTNAVHVLSADGAERSVPLSSKDEVAAVVLDVATALLP